MAVRGLASTGDRSTESAARSRFGEAPCSEKSTKYFSRKQAEERTSSERYPAAGCINNNHIISICKRHDPVAYGWSPKLSLYPIVRHQRIRSSSALGYRFGQFYPFVIISINFLDQAHIRFVDIRLFTVFSYTCSKRGVSGVTIANGSARVRDSHRRFYIEGNLYVSK